MQQEIQNAYEALLNGGVILYPTDTIWGIGCDATNSEAVKKIFKLKQRSEAKSMIILVSSENMLYRHFDKIPETAFQIWEIADRPTTLVLDNPKNLAPELIASDNSIGVRWVKEPFCYKLVERLKKPLVSTSANISDRPHPNNFSEISTEIVKGVDYTVSLYPNQTMSQPSSIIKLGLDGMVRVVRK